MWLIGQRRNRMMMEDMVEVLSKLPQVFAVTGVRVRGFTLFGWRRERISLSCRCIGINRDIFTNPYHMMLTRTENRWDIDDVRMNIDIIGDMTFIREWRRNGGRNDMEFLHGLDESRRSDVAEGDYDALVGHEFIGRTVPRRSRPGHGRYPVTDIVRSRHYATYEFVSPADITYNPEGKSHDIVWSGR